MIQIPVFNPEYLRPSQLVVNCNKENTFLNSRRKNDVQSYGKGCEQKPYLVWFPCPLSGASEIRCPLSVPAIRYSDSLLGIVECADKN